MLISPLQNMGTLTTDWIQLRPVVTQVFAANPEIYKRFGLLGHNGIDLRAKEGTPVYAPISGLIMVRDDGGTGYGLHVKIRGGDNEVVLAHLSRVFAKHLSEVKMGDKIALTGNTGFSTGPHLHFGLRKLIPASGNITSWQVRDAGNGYAGYLDVGQWTLTWKGSLINPLIQ